MAIERRSRYGKEYYYYKLRNSSVYVGNSKKPNREGIEKALRHCNKRKTRVDKDIEFLEKLLKPEA